MTVLVSRKNLGMVLVEPQGRGRRRGCQIDRDAGLAKLVDDAIEPVEIPMVFDGLEAISGEDGKGHGVDAGLAHQADVVIPDSLRPLVGTIVATESDAASVRGQ